MSSVSITTTRPPNPTSSTQTTSASQFDEDDEQQPRILVVSVGTVRYGIPVGQVREVVRPERITRVPGAPATVRGIVNVRGAIVTVLDLAALLSGERAVTAGSVVLLEHGTRFIGLAVDTVRDVQVVDLARDTASESSTHGDVVVPLDAAALCAQHLLSSEEMGP